MADNMYGYNDYNGPLCDHADVSKDEDIRTHEEDEEDDPLRSGLWMEGDSLAPPCGTSVSTIHKMLAFARVSSRDVLYDLGCGDGRVCLEALARFGAASCVGVEVEEDLANRFRQLIQGLPPDMQPRIRCIHADLRQTLKQLVHHKNVHHPMPTIIVLYLLPEAIAEIEHELVKLMDLVGSMRILCNTWGLKGLEPVVVTEIEEPGGATTSAFLYNSTTRC